jgi:hypothetical protein
VKSSVWPWVLLLLLPGCVLVAPLDEAKPSDGSDAGSGGRPAGTAGSSGSPAKAGSGNAGRGGGAPNGGAANGGAPNGGAFSLFLGTWTIADGKNTTTCDPGTTETSDVEPGLQDTFGRGTITDLIFDPGTACEILADVNDHTAFLNSNTEGCSYSDDTFVYDLYFDAFEFVVSSDGQTAKASMTAYIQATDADNNTSYCQSDTTWNYER